MEKTTQILPIDPSSFPKHFETKDEIKWMKKWHETKIYEYNPNSSKERYAIDTPPPTVSGSLHLGHCFSYTHADIIARYQRMKGKEIFYPMGWDDNGLPSERRVQNYFHCWCKGDMPYEPGLELKEATAKEKKGPRKFISRKNFIEHCERLTKHDEESFKQLFSRLSLSVDWREEYATINKKSRRTAQLSFLDLYEKGHLYQSEAPTTWDIDFQTAIAQAEIIETPQDSTFNTLEFSIIGEPNETFNIATTRPELLPACIAVAAHPNDERYKKWFGKKALTPLFHAPIPILPSEDANPDKGTGILMICCFGDSKDVIFWREKSLPLRQIIGKDGTFMDITFYNDESSLFISNTPELANKYYSQLKGLPINKARTKILELLKDPAGSANLNNKREPLRESKQITHEVKFFEKGSRPLEIIPTRQWFVKLIDKKDKLLEQGSKVTWYPPQMENQYRDWTSNLAYDWCISRQRYFGVPFPCWYKLDSNGKPIYNAIILPSKDELPIDPMFDTPKGYTEADRGIKFIGESDVFDTWFTSSLTPQIASDWADSIDDGKTHGEKSKHDKLFPFNLRPQSHEIIRTWAFYTIAKSLLHENEIPWKEIGISGWVIDKTGQKYSKSAGNASVEPPDLINEYGADSIRYWSAGAALGSDTYYTDVFLKNGRKLVTKLFNAGKLTFSLGCSSDAKPSHPMDIALLASLKKLIEESNENFASYKFSKVLKDTETFFWNYFTDNYLELTKTRSRSTNDTERESAIITLRIAMHILLRLFAPMLPYITEEIWSWSLAKTEGYDSIHIAPYPSSKDLNFIKFGQDSAAEMDTTIACITELRKYKSDNKLKFMDEIKEHLTISANPTSIRLLKQSNSIDGIISIIKFKNYELKENTQLADGIFTVSASTPSCN